MSKSEDKVTVSHYQIDQNDKFGAKVKMVVSRSDNSLVYLIEGNQLRYEFVNLKFEMTKVMGRFDELRGKISDDLPENIKLKSLISIGLALFHASRTKTEEDALKAINQVEDRISKLKSPNFIGSNKFNLLCFTISSLPSYFSCQSLVRTKYSSLYISRLFWFVIFIITKKFNSSFKFNWWRFLHFLAVSFYMCSRSFIRSSFIFVMYLRASFECGKRKLSYVNCIRDDSGI